MFAIQNLKLSSIHYSKNSIVKTITVTELPLELINFQFSQSWVKNFDGNTAIFSVLLEYWANPDQVKHGQSQ